MEDDDHELCWADQMGDRLEKEGVDSGRIYESSIFLTRDCLPGVMVVTNAKLRPGTAPTSPLECCRVIVRLRNGDEQELINETGCRPVLVANWRRLQPTLC